MTIEILILGLMVGITILAYEIALNSEGAAKLSVSYLMATLILAGTTWAIVEHFNTEKTEKQKEMINQLKQERNKAENTIRSKKKNLQDKEKKLNAKSDLLDIARSGESLANKLINVKLRDFSADLDVLMGRASAKKKECKELRAKLNKMEKEGEQFFPEVVKLLRSGIEELSSSANYYYLYYKSEDTAQEELRARLLRRMARSGEGKFRKAASLLEKYE